MMPLAFLRQRLVWKLLLSYFIITAVGVVVLTVTAEFQAPAALARHITRMQAQLGFDPALAADLLSSFHAAVVEIMFVAAMASALASVVLGIFTARRIVGPITAMAGASRRIAAGDYDYRVQVPGQDELAALASDFNRMAEELERTEERRMALIGYVAHELRTPLTSIKSLMEGLVDGVLQAEPQTFVRVDHEITRLQQLVDDLQRLSRAEAGQLQLDCRPVQPSELLRPAAERLSPQYEAKGVALRVITPAGLPRAWADPARITQVLLNLLGNALQYSPPGRRVDVSARREGQEILIQVQDTGIGIPSEDLPHVFERFYRVDKSRSRSGGGSGVGLTIARHITEAHGGRIWAASDGPGCGSTFSFSLPQAP